MAKVRAAVVAVASKGKSQKGKKAAAAAKTPKAKASHPPVWEMVTNAIKMLKERGGSSLPAIKKYLTGNYNVDVDRLAPFIRKYLKSAVLNGILIQTKGKGACGSFKLSKSVAKRAASKEVTKKLEKEKSAGNSKKQLAYGIKAGNTTKAKASHPPTWEMVTNAIKMLNERGGSSLLAIKKYIAGNYNVDIDRYVPFIRKYLRSAVLNGILIQTKGKGACGSFKLSRSVAKRAAGNSKKQLASVTKVEKKTKAKTRRPPASEMVTIAIKMLKKRGGSSLPAIKKYIEENYNVDVDRFAPYIRKYLKDAVSKGVLIQTKGKGASGSFKLSKSVKPTKVVGDLPKHPTPEKIEKKEKTAKTLEEMVMHPNNSLLQNLQMLQQNLQNQLN